MKRIALIKMYSLFVYLILLSSGLIMQAQVAPSKYKETKEAPQRFTTASGLQYEVLKKGDNQTPKGDDIVKFHYVGTLDNGTVFDKSNGAGEPLTAELSTMQIGLQEGLMLMGAGAKYRFIIPAKLAYGSEGGGGGRIPPDSRLTYVIDMLQVGNGDANVDNQGEEKESEVEKIMREAGLPPLTDEEKKEIERDAKNMVAEITDPKNKKIYDDFARKDVKNNDALFKMTELLIRKQNITKKFNDFRTIYSEPATNAVRLKLLNGIIAEYQAAQKEAENAEKLKINYSSTEKNKILQYKNYYSKALEILIGMKSGL